MRSCAVSPAHGWRSRTAPPRLMSCCIRHEEALQARSTWMKGRIKNISFVSLSFYEGQGNDDCIGRPATRAERDAAAAVDGGVRIHQDVQQSSCSRRDLLFSPLR